MHLAILPFTLLLGSYVAATPSIKHAQISVDITNMDAHDKVDALHPSEDRLVMQDVGYYGFPNLEFNFTLNARFANGPASLPFGFANLEGSDGFVRGQLGFRTEFAFRNGKLINGNRALGYHVARIFPPWTSLWSLKEGAVHSFPELIAIPQNSGRGKYNYFLEFVKSGKLLNSRFCFYLIFIFFLFFFIHYKSLKRRANWYIFFNLKDLIFGADAIKRGDAVFVGSPSRK